MALVFDEYDAGRADVMFVIQRILEVEGRLTLLDQSRVIEPHPSFRLFATANTVGLGDASGLYHGTQTLNQGQMDRWNIVVTLNYLEHDREVDVVLARCPEYRNADGRAQVGAMVALANLTRRGFGDGDLSTLMSPRTVVTWAQTRTRFQTPPSPSSSRSSIDAMRTSAPSSPSPSSAAWAGPSRGSARARPEVSGPFPDKTIKAVGACTRALGQRAFA